MVEEVGKGEEGGMAGVMKEKVVEGAEEVVEKERQGIRELLRADEVEEER